MVNSCRTPTKVSVATITSVCGVGTFSFVNDIPGNVFSKRWGTKLSAVICISYRTPFYSQNEGVIAEVLHGGVFNSPSLDTDPSFTIKTPKGES